MTEKEIGLKKISPSALDCYIQCPRLFYYKYWLGLKLPEDQRHLKFGTAFHAAIESIYLQYDNHFGGGWMAASLEKALTEFETRFHLSDITDDEWSRAKLLKKNIHNSKEELYEYMKADGISMIEHYWKEKEHLLTEHGIDINENELSMKVQLKNPLNKEDILPIPMSLRMDGRTRGKKKIVEFKTSSGKYNEEGTRNKIQGRAYCFAHLMETGELPEEVIYVVNLKDKRFIQVVKNKYDIADMVSFFNEVKVILQKIANKEFGYGKVSGFARMEIDRYDTLLGLKD